MAYLAAPKTSDRNGIGPPFRKILPTPLLFYRSKLGSTLLGLHTAKRRAAHCGNLTGLSHKLFKLLDKN